MNFRRKYYAWRRNRLRTKARQFDKKKWWGDNLETMGLMDKWVKVSLKWYKYRPVSLFEGQPLGLDITFSPFTMDELRKALREPPSPVTTNRGKHLSAEWRWSGPGSGEPELRHVGDNHVDVEFWDSGLKDTYPSISKFVVRNGVVDIPNWLSDEERADAQARFDAREA